MVETMRLSICVPSRNRQFYFQKTIEGLLRNKRDDIEFVFVDNSDDPSIMNDFMRAYADDPRVHFDGQVTLDLQAGDSVRLRRSEHKICFLHPPGYSYFAMLRQKLSGVDIGLVIVPNIASPAVMDFLAREGHDILPADTPVMTILPEKSNSTWARERPHLMNVPARPDVAGTLRHGLDLFPRTRHLLVVTDIYPAGEAPRPGVSGKLIVNAVLDAHPWRPLAYLPKRPDLVPYLRSVLRPGDLCLTLGAGDLTSLADEVQAALRP